MLEKLILSIVVFSLVSTMIGNMTQDRVYKKYISGFSGILFVIMIINPVLSFFDDGIMEKIYDKYRFMFQGDEYKLDSTGWEKEYSEATQKEYEEIVREKIQKLVGDLCSVNKCEIEYENNIESDNYGEIYMISLSVGMIDNLDDANADEADNGIKKIEKISIGKKQEKNDKTESRGYKEMGEKIKESIADYFELEKDNIVIEYQ